MNLLKNPVLTVVGLLALMIIIFAGCSEDPTDPNRNTTPETSITTYRINTAPDTAASFTVTVYWRASDPDGRPEYYRYWVTSGGTTVINQTETFETSAEVRLDFTNPDTTYTFHVQARDSQNAWDPTPAEINISATDVRDITGLKPQTEAVTMPPNGFQVARGVQVVVSGRDFDGFVPTIQWAVDDTAAWQSIAIPDSLITQAGSVTSIIIDSTFLTLGPHTLYFRAIDNWGNIDPSPLSASVVVVDNLAPDLWVAFGAIANAFYFLPSGGTTVDLSTSWVGDAAWYFSPVEFRYAVDDSTAWTDWMDTSGATLTGLSAGSHTFYLQARDLAGNITQFSTVFGVGQLVGDRGIIIINGVSFNDYGQEAVDLYANLLPIGSFGYDTWDLLEATDPTAPYPAVFEDSMIGNAGPVPGDTLGHYSSAIFFMNAFGGDDAVFATMAPLVMSYLNAGGNVLILGRYGSIYFTADMLAYGVSEAQSFAQVGVNPSILEPAVDGLVAMTRFASSSFTDLLAVSSDPNVTTLFTVPEFTDAVGGMIVQPEAGGKLAFIAGRMYRFDSEPIDANVSYILTNYFGEQ